MRASAPINFPEVSLYISPENRAAMSELEFQKIVQAWQLSSVTRLGDFWTFSATNFLASPNRWLLGYFEKHHIWLKSVVVTFWQLFGTIKLTCLKKVGQSRPLFCLFSSFSHYNFNNTNWKKHKWCAWERLRWSCGDLVVSIHAIYSSALTQIMLPSNGISVHLRRE